ncbi:glycosyltransferase family 4 protein [Patescibacteria group bacterium]|nr:glycosyltransferase family 4 protein [Patescibacteria group bacterium]
MRILFVTPFYKPYFGGIERVIEKLSEQLLKDSRIQKIGVLTTKWTFPKWHQPREYHPEWADYEIIDGIEVYRINSWPRRAIPFFQVPLVWHSLGDIRRAIKEFKPDTIQWMSDKFFWGNFWSWYFAKMTGLTIFKSSPVNNRLKPVSTSSGCKIFFSPSYHDLTFLKQWLRPINAVLMRLADKIQVITELEKNKVRRAYFVPEAKFVIIPWGINKLKVKSAVPAGRQEKLKVRNEIQARSSTRQENAPFSPKPVTILSVGRISRHKGQMWLVKIFKELTEICKQPCKQPLKLVLIGQDEGDKEKIENYAFQNDLASQVIITGHISDDELQRWYERADIFALFPEYEAFGLVFIEAMSYGLPVVTHRVGAIPEVLKDKALITDPYNTAQAKIVLAKLINDIEHRQNIGTAGKQFVEVNYSWEKTARELLNIRELTL